MNLLLDLGNTRCKWLQGDYSGVASCTTELAAQWAALPAPSRLVGCAVASLTQQAEIDRLAQNLWGSRVNWLSAQARACGVTNRYARPAQLGADRWAAAIGAHVRHPGQDLILVSAGTALVVDALNAQGDFLGGMILPGYRLMKEALATQTARLPLAQGRFLPFPDNTDDAIETGCLSALTGAIFQMQQRLPGATLLISGGDATLLAPLLNSSARVVDNLVLHGLDALAKENTQ